MKYLRTKPSKLYSSGYHHKWELKFLVTCHITDHQFSPLNLQVWLSSRILLDQLFPCNADGRPSPVIRWVKHDGQAVPDLPGLRHVRHDGALVFPPFPAEDYRADVHATIYRCEISNVIGTLGSRDVHVRAGKCFLGLKNFDYKRQKFNITSAKLTIYVVGR
ncbi:down syndrome cell adhesion molecule-like protein Dscam2 [Caerostris darwini]|uniref:Down syndrome cell adhesion molecule-like protein Dscam2 n=1 Tax=Caerostris darwini TaxID=1538125 RepID=A0AAV4N0D7_9ARAC|nr:down syndrome cell adhesion molecule-like protein Dscam2 [Caerostris darwini]